MAAFHMIGFANGPPVWLAAAGPIARNALVEGIAAGARTLSIGVVDGEALLLDRVDEVDRRATEIRGAHSVGDHTDAAEVLQDVSIEVAVVEEELVAKARTAPGLHGDPQGQVVSTFGLQEGFHLAGSFVGQHDAVGRLGVHHVAHVVVLLRGTVSCASRGDNHSRRRIIPTIA